MASPSPAPNTQVELARERNRIASDRTLLAWIRTSIALIGVGFGVDQVISKLFQNANADLSVPLLPKLLMLLIVGIGVFAVVMAALDYQGEHKRLRQPEYAYTPRPELGMIVGGALVAIAILALIATWDVV